MDPAKPARFPVRPWANRSSSLEYSFLTGKEEPGVHDLYRLSVSASRTLGARAILLSQGEHSAPLSNPGG